MEIILKEDVANLGYKNDIVTVKSGYGRNYLIPTGKAVIASPAAKKMLAEELKQRAHKLEKIKKDAEAVAESLKNVTLTIPTRLVQQVLSTVLLLTSRLLTNWLSWVTTSIVRSSLLRNRLKKLATTKQSLNFTRKFLLKFLSKLLQKKLNFAICKYLIKPPTERKFGRGFFMPSNKVQILSEWHKNQI